MPASASAPASGVPRPGGRPRSTSRAELALVAMGMFAERGFEETTVDHIATAAGVSRRTFFRYFPTKTSVLWNDFDAEVTTIGRLLAECPPEQPMMQSIRTCVVRANHYRIEDLPELRARMTLLGTVPSLQASAALHYEAWEQAIADFVAARTGASPRSLYPLAVGRATLAVCRAAYDIWAARQDGDLVTYLDDVLARLAEGFG